MTGENGCATRIEDLIQSGELLINDGYRAKNAELSSSGLPFARAGNINNGFHFEGADCFPLEDIEKVGFKVSQPGDVVFTSKGTVGRFAFVLTDTPRFVYAPQLCFWRSLNCELIDPQWLYFWMHGREFFLQYKGVAGQTDMAEYVSLRDQRKMRITIPPLPEQKAIAGILGALDDKIELNRRMNATLEALARATFKSWFVDFDPVRAKMDGRQPPGMPADLAALFPDSLEHVDGELVPEGWKKIAVRDVTEGLYDGPHATPPKSDDGPVFLGIRNLTGTKVDLSDIRHISEEDWPRWTKRIEPQQGDIVFTYEATLGYFALIPPNLRCCLGRRLALVRPKENERLRHFLFHSFTSDPFLEFLDAHAIHGATVNRVSLSEFPSYPLLWPSSKLVTQFENIVERYWARIFVNDAEAGTLAALRDALLPKLLSGELRVGDAERVVGEVV